MGHGLGRPQFCTGMYVFKFTPMDFVSHGMVQVVCAVDFVSHGIEQVVCAVDFVSCRIEQVVCPCTLSALRGMQG